MIDTNKLVAALDEARGRLETHKALADLSLTFDPTFAPFIHQKGKNDGAREALEAIKRGIETGLFDVEAVTIPAPAPTPEKYGVFYIGGRKGPERSGNLPADYDTRSEAWSDIYESSENGSGLDPRYYQVQAI